MQKAPTEGKIKRERIGAPILISSRASGNQTRAPLAVREPPCFKRRERVVSVRLIRRGRGSGSACSAADSERGSNEGGSNEPKDTGSPTE
jgi:hypothetical protein